MRLDTLRIHSLTQHWRIIDGIVYRDAWCFDPAGDLTLFAIRDDLTAQL